MCPFAEDEFDKSAAQKKETEGKLESLKASLEEMDSTVETLSSEVKTLQDEIVRHERGAFSEPSVSVRSATCFICCVRIGMRVFCCLFERVIGVFVC